MTLLKITLVLLRIYICFFYQETLASKLQVCVPACSAMFWVWNDLMAFQPWLWSLCAWQWVWLCTQEKRNAESAPNGNQFRPKPDPAPLHCMIRWLYHSHAVVLPTICDMSMCECLCPRWPIRCTGSRFPFRLWLVSLVPRPCPAFCRLQYRKAVRMWAWHNQQMAKKILNEKEQFHVLFNQLQVQCLVRTASHPPLATYMW